MIASLPKIFRQPEILHDMVTYRYSAVAPVTRANWQIMNRRGPDSESGLAAGFPYLLQIEPSSRCNLGCAACPAGSGLLNRGQLDLPLAGFQSIVDDMRDYLLLLVLWGWGEPFLNRDLPRMVRYASERGIRTVTSTNGHFLDDRDYLAELLRAGLSTLIVAVDSLSPEDYAAFRKGGELDRVVAGLPKLLELRRRLGASTLINLRMVALKRNEAQIDTLRRFSRDLGVDLFTVKTANPGNGNSCQGEGIVPDNPKLRRYRYHAGTGNRIRQASRCRLPWTLGTIQADGDVVPCCYDFDAEMRVGNIFDQPFSAIWQGEPYRALRRRIAARAAELNKCRGCDTAFRLSPTGWFYEVLECADQGPMTRLRNRLLRPKLRTVLNQVRKRL